MGFEELQDLKKARKKCQNGEWEFTERPFFYNWRKTSKKKTGKKKSISKHCIFINLIPLPPTKSLMLLFAEIIRTSLQFSHIRVMVQALFPAELRKTSLSIFPPTGSLLAPSPTLDHHEGEPHKPWSLWPCVVMPLIPGFYSRPPWLFDQKIHFLPYSVGLPSGFHALNLR